MILEVFSKVVVKAKNGTRSGESEIIETCVAVVSERVGTQTKPESSSPITKP
jgi:hypothetical protein